MPRNDTPPASNEPAIQGTGATLGPYEVTANIGELVLRAPRMPQPPDGRADYPENMNVPARLLLNLRAACGTSRGWSPGFIDMRKSMSGVAGADLVCGHEKKNDHAFKTDRERRHLC